MRKTSVLLAIVAVVIFGLNASAQEEVVGRDILEVSFYGGLGVPTGGITDWTTGAEIGDIQDRPAKAGWDLAMDIGYYVSYRFNVGINFRYTEFGIDVEEDQSHVHRLYNPNIYAKYSFEGESYWVPFVKVHAGLENPKFSTWVTDENDGGRRKYRELSYDPAFAFGATAGLFYYTADFSGIFLEAGYHYALTDGVTGNYQGTDYAFGENLGTFTLNFGVKIIIGTGE